MTVEEFYEFCKKRSNNGGMANREVALTTTWQFLWGQHSTSKEEIEGFLDAQISELGQQNHLSLVDAYTWLKGILLKD